MTQNPQSGQRPQQGQQGQPTPGRPRPRPGAQPVQGAPGFQQNPQYVNYEQPRMYDTSVRPMGSLTRARYDEAHIERPQAAQPQSAWATQSRRIQDVNQGSSAFPVSRIIAWVLVALLALAFLVVLAYFFVTFALSTSSSPLMWPIFAVLAGFSLLVIIGVIVLADRWDPQPPRFMVIAVLWGGAIAVGIAYVLNTLFSILVYVASGDGQLADLLGAVISAPFVEESAKGLGLVLLFLLGRRYFNGPLDGLLYGALIGGGFAFTENILYYGNGWESGGAASVILMVIIRGIVNIFGHAIYTSLTGVIMGLVARKWGTLPGALVFLVATWPGMFLHATWNGSSFILSILGMGPLGSLVLMCAGEILLSLLWFGLIAFLIHDESRLTRVRLGDYANLGWLTHEEVTMLATWKGRRQGRAWAKSIHAAPTMKRFIRESSDLASVRQRLLADGANPKAVQNERELLNRLTANRSELMARAGMPA